MKEGIHPKVYKAKITCACGFENDSDADFCAYCGRPRGGVMTQSDVKSGGR